MDNDEFRTVRVYTKKYTSKDKNGNSVEKESKQKQVSLKKEDPFEDDDLVKVLSQKEYNDLIDKQVSDDKLKEYDEIIKQSRIHSKKPCAVPAPTPSAFVSTAKPASGSANVNAADVEAITKEILKRLGN